MTTIRQMQYCSACSCETLHEKRKGSEVFNLLMALLTGGLWILIWVAIPLRFPGAQCTICGGMALSGC
jgi:hypothetical protein